MKKALLIITFLLIAGYLLFSVFYFKEKPNEQVCHEFEVVISNADNDQFIDTDEIKKSVKESGLDPREKRLADINTIEIENHILQNKHIKKAEVYVTNSNNIRVVLEERKPILRVIPNEGASYYIDNEGEKMPTSRRYTAYLPVATGSIKDAFAREELYKFALFLQEDEFWDAQVEQIIVKPNHDIELVPRVGDHTIIIGSLDNLDKKLDRLMTFYHDGLNRIGWNKYSSINVKFDKQVVCTRR